MKPLDLYTAAHMFEADQLRLAREYRGLQRKELAKLLGVTPSAVSQYEAGRIKPTPQMISRMKLALHFPVGFFVEPPSSSVAVDQCHFRSLRSCTQTQRRRMAAAATLVGGLVAHLAVNVDFPTENLLLLVSDPPDSDEEIEGLAVDARKHWGLGLGPITHISKLVESHGVVVSRTFHDCAQVDAFSLWHSARPLIFLNADKNSGTRSRYDVAHELGHLVMHTDCLPGDQRHEQQAHRFAGAFLLPRETFGRECPRRLIWPHLLELKERWGVSLSAIAHRAFDIGLFSASAYRRANVQLSQRGWRDKEPQEPLPEEPTLLRRALSLLETTGKTLASIASELNMTQHDIELLVGGPFQPQKDRPSLSFGE